MNLMKYIVSTAAVFILSTPVFGKDATLSGTSLSIDLDVANTNVGANYLFTTYEVFDGYRIRIHAKDFFPATVFTRNGNTYAATVELTDGGSDTFWPDYQKWYLRIEDANDSDGDGIPDLSDKIDNSALGHLSALLLLLFQ